MKSSSPSRHSIRLSLWIAFLLLTVAAPGFRLGAQEVAATISPDEVYRGQKGYGLSVFEGGEPERFDVEVLGVWRNRDPGASAILARLSGRGLEETGVIAGMSGSPVYLDGKLAGAVAFSWDFSQGAIAGITPIGAMRQVSLGDTSPSQPRSSAPLGEPPATLEQLVRRELPEDLLERELRRLAGGPARTATAASSSLLWTFGGFGEQSQRLLNAGLGTGGATLALAGATSEEAGLDLNLAPGSSVSAVLVRGDLSLAATGTVTDRTADQVLAFGHPFLSLGALNVPMAASEVITVIPSRSSSFKLSNIGPIVGAFRQDRQAALFGRMGAQAPMIPLTVELAGPGVTEPRSYRMEVAEIRSLTPTLIAVAVLGTIDTSGHSVGAQGLDIEARIKLKGYDEIHLRQSYDGANAGTQAAAYLLSATGLLFQSSLEEVELERVEVELRRHPEIRSTSILRAYTDRLEVRPGQTIPIYLDLMAHGGEARRHRMEVTLPDDLPDGPYFLLIADGATGDSARLTLEPLAPSRFQQQVDFLQSLHSLRQIQILGLLPSPGLFIEGEVLPSLPGSIRKERKAAAGGLSSDLNLTIVQHEVEDFDVPLAGVARLDLKVRRQ